MKQIKYLSMLALALLVCVSICSCGESDDNGGGNSGLAGTWKRDLGYGSSETLTLGSDGSFNSSTYTPGRTIGGKWYSSSTQTRKGSYTYTTVHENPLTF